jgi:hypothetical protein
MKSALRYYKTFLKSIMNKILILMWI